MLFIDMTGKKCGRWTVLRQGKTDRRKRIHWTCRCECGTERDVEGTNLRGGHSISCGCFSSDTSRELNTTHGMTGTRIYDIWRGMMSRCYNSAVASYPDYGGRGIKVCDRWHVFENFFADMGHRPSDDLTMDRINNNGDYCPENCRWATKKEQVSNRRNCIYIDTPDGKITISEAARRAGISWFAMRSRVRQNLPLDRLFAPAHRAF